MEKSILLPFSMFMDSGLGCMSVFFLTFLAFLSYPDQFLICTFVLCICFLAKSYCYPIIFGPLGMTKLYCT